MSHQGSSEEIARQLHDIYGSKLEEGERLHSFVSDVLFAWPGRAIDPAAADPIILAEGARATKTYGGVLCLGKAGFGPQASMLDRSLFEGMAVAHWAHANPGRAVHLFKKHGRYSELLWGDAFEKAEPYDPRIIDSGTEIERQQLGNLFGKYGTKLWTGHDSLYSLVSAIEDQWPVGSPRRMLWWFFRIAHRDNDQVLHSTALGLSAGVTRGTQEFRFDAGPSSHYLDRGLLGALWSFGQLATLLWDHFDLPDRAGLDAVLADASARFS